MDKIKAVRDYAVAHYETGGWDYVVEAWNEDYISRVTANCKSEAGAIRAVGKIAAILDGERKEVESTIW